MHRSYGTSYIWLYCLYSLLARITSRVTMVMYCVQLLEASADCVYIAGDLRPSVTADEVPPPWDVTRTEPRDFWS